MGVNPEIFEGLPAGSKGLPAWSKGLPARLGGDVHTDGRTDGKSPHSTGLRPLLGPLPKKSCRMELAS